MEIIKARVVLAIIFLSSTLWSMDQKIWSVRQKEGNPFNDIEVSDSCLQLKITLYMQELKKNKVAFTKKGKSNLKEIFTSPEVKNAQSQNTVCADHQLFIPLFMHSPKVENAPFISRFFHNMELAVLQQSIVTIGTCFYPDDMEKLFPIKREKIKNEEQCNTLKFEQNNTKAIYNMFLCFDMDYLEKIYRTDSVKKLCNSMIEEFAQQQKKIVEDEDLRNKFNTCIKKVENYMQKLENK